LYQITALEYQKNELKNEVKLRKRSRIFAKKTKCFCKRGHCFSTYYHKL